MSDFLKIRYGAEVSDTYSFRKFAQRKIEIRNSYPLDYNFIKNSSTRFTHGRCYSNKTEQCVLSRQYSAVQRERRRTRRSRNVYILRNFFLSLTQ